MVFVPSELRHDIGQDTVGLQRASCEHQLAGGPLELPWTSDPT